MFVSSVQKIIDEVGDGSIDEVNVCRVALSKPIMALLNLASRGEFQKGLKETPYDTLYHLYMTFRVNKGASYMLEKNEVIMLSRKKHNANAEIMPVATKDNLTLNILLDNAKAKMGGKFFTYKAMDNNCQFFVQSILQASGINTPELDKFVHQEVSVLFDNDSRFRKLANTVTDVGKVVRENAVVDSALTKFQEQGKPKFNALVDKIKSAKDVLAGVFKTNPFSR